MPEPSLPGRSRARSRTQADTSKPDRRYLYRIGGRWYARIPVPSQLRKAFGSPVYQRALGTADLNEARKRRWDVLEEARAVFARHLQGQADSPPDASYEAWRAHLKRMGSVTPAPDGDDITPPDLQRIMDALTAEDADEDDPRVRAVRDHLQGLPVASEVLDDYLTHNPKRSATTETNYRASLRQWAQGNGDHPLTGVTRRQAVQWLDTVAQGKARDTVKRHVTVMSHLWDWAHRLEENPPSNPFRGLQQAAGKRGHAARGYEVFTGDELQRLFAALEADPALHAVALVSLYSGLRLNECLTAKRHTVGGVECFDLEGGKTVNARRIVPVHPRLADVTVPQDVNAKALSVRFSRLGKTLALPEGKTFHSLRKCFTTALERSGCPEDIAVRLLGHRPVSLSYRVYSAGHDAADLKRWVETVAFGV
ncbi:DUF6538 domain-containing protein [Roseospira goensis]|uniref:Integrase n=1 Tax=Roseospira goensis TaxID=391922 RepID=A0A7W6RWI4_9PROT|nr:DUF6538 domain-containing protein [Roseospira goensis]MBB4284525.1 integrase [Roseospira goensis]